MFFFPHRVSGTAFIVSFWLLVTTSKALVTRSDALVPSSLLFRSDKNGKCAWCSISVRVEAQDYLRNSTDYTGLKLSCPRRLSCFKPHACVAPVWHKSISRQVLQKLLCSL